MGDDHGLILPVAGLDSARERYVSGVEQASDMHKPPYADLPFRLVERRLSLPIPRSVARLGAGRASKEEGPS
jgi:hypothetical protein